MSSGVPPYSPHCPVHVLPVRSSSLWDPGKQNPLFAEEGRHSNEISRSAWNIEAKITKFKAQLASRRLINSFPVDSRLNQTSLEPRLKSVCYSKRSDYKSVQTQVLTHQKHSLDIIPNY